MNYAYTEQEEQNNAKLADAIRVQSWKIKEGI